MPKHSFLDDYSEGCHPQILEALANTNLEQQTAYGDDEYSLRAKALLRQHLGGVDVPIYFVAGGTLANLTIVSSALRSHEAVVAAASGHIVVRETGAIEATGHKIITVASEDGKLAPSDIEQVMTDNAHYPHMAKPRLVYISNATETGTVYVKAELQKLAETCKANGLLLMLDGARLAVALSASINDLTLKDIAEVCDVFWIGGTKAGALIGEAIVIPNTKLADDFAFHVKQRGALLAKGPLLGIQFQELFSEDLFFTLTQHANLMAQKLSAEIASAGYSQVTPTESNQIFPVLPNTLIESLRQQFGFYVWAKFDNESSVIRMVTSWATVESQIDEFASAIQ